MNKKIVTISSLMILLGAPVAVLALIFPPTPPGAGFNLLVLINTILNLIWPVFIGFSVIMFIVAGFNFLTAEGDPTKVKESMKAVIYGVAGVVVGIIAFSLPIVLANLFST